MLARMLRHAIWAGALLLCLAAPAAARPIPIQALPWMGRDVARALPRPTDNGDDATPAHPKTFQGDWNAFTVEVPAPVAADHRASPAVEQFTYLCAFAECKLSVRFVAVRDATMVADNVAHPSKLADDLAQESGHAFHQIQLGDAPAMETTFDTTAGVHSREVAVQSADGRMLFVLDALWSGQRPDAVGRFFETFKMGALDLPPPPSPLVFPALVPFEYKGIIALRAPDGWALGDRSKDGQVCLIWLAPGRRGFLVLIVADILGGNKEAVRDFLKHQFSKLEADGMVDVRSA
ncbi:MAG TPA: hypothetical protein VGO93_31780, partial [Candidatus Xenobia bacterium]